MMEGGESCLPEFKEGRQGEGSRGRPYSHSAATKEARGLLLREERVPRCKDNRLREEENDEKIFQ
jgi:hypothetical protein